MLSITVVVCAYNEARWIETCINSLLEQQAPMYAIVIINDGSTDHTAEVLTQFRDHQNVKIINLAENVGVPAARNIGITHADTDLVAFLDADGSAPPDWLGRLRNCFLEPTVAIAGGPDHAPGSDTPFALSVDYSLRSWLATGRLRQRNPFAPYAPAGCNLAIRRSALEEVGYFDERLDQRGEDKELVQRIRRAGHDVVHCQEAFMWHHRRVNPKQFWRQNYHSGCARIDILRLAPDAFSLAYLMPAAIVLVLSLSLLGLLSGFSTVTSSTLLTLYLALLLTDASTAAFHTRNWSVAMRVPLTTALIHLGYGCGFITGSLRWLFGQPVGSGKPRHTTDISSNTE